jgi:S-adenosylmethionine hydrolase
VVLSLAPHAVLVDISHAVPARDVQAGAFALAQAAPLFPPGTIHVGVVDPGVGGARAEVVVAAGDALFVGPDNGLFSLAAPEPRRAWRIQNPAFRREPVSATFHGRDVFAPTAGRLAAGWTPEQAGAALEQLTTLPMITAPLGDGGEGQVLHVDGFGNVFTSFTGTPQGNWELALGQRTFTLLAGRTFGDVAPGALVLYPGSGGQIEIGVRDGSAAALTGGRAGMRISLRRRA